MSTENNNSDCTSSQDPQVIKGPRNVMVDLTGKTEAGPDYYADDEKEVLRNTNSPHFNRAIHLIVAIAVLGGVSYGIFAFLRHKGISLKPPEGLPAAVTENEITYSELALHNTPEDCWLQIHGNVYDLTEYANRHPGGAFLITDYAGTDATEEYDNFHSEKLLPTIASSLIGRIVGIESTIAPISHGTSVVTSTSAEISLSELALHTTTNDLWVAFHGVVYDLTTYVHPAGQDYITGVAGTDGTASFDAFHPFSYLDMFLADLVVGTLIQEFESTIAPSSFDTNVTISTSAEISLSELALHTTTSDLWVAFHGVVYDLTTYVHPAGQDYITGVAGTDGTASFDAFHPFSYLDLFLADLVVGTLIQEFESTIAPSNAGTSVVASTSAEISLSELALHSTTNDLWVAFHGVVYDLTTYVHPAGQDYITSVAGTDGTASFDAFHPLSYLDMFLADLVVGTLIQEYESTIAPTSFDTGMTTSAPAEISLSELALHTTTSDLWVAFHGVVYDLTTYVHPAGQAYITGVAGTDGTASFDAFHPLSYLDMFLADLVVGTLIQEYESTIAPTSFDTTIQEFESTIAPSDVGTTIQEFQSTIAPSNVATNVTTSTSAKISFSELALHTTTSDLWVAFHGVVYDLTTYVHPAGEAFITSVAGTDGTDSFDAFHPFTYLDLFLADLVIGELAQA